MGLLDGAVDWGIKTGVKHFARLWRNDGFLGEPVQTPPAGTDPVILVNGFSVYNEVLAPAMRSLKRDGFKVYAPELPNNAMDHIDGTAQYLRDYIQKVLKETGAKKVDLVGFSEGGLVVRAYVKNFGGTDAVDSAISMATPHNGVLASPLGKVVDAVWLLRKGTPEAAREMLAGSPFLKKLNAGDPTPDQVRWTSIYSRGFDGIVWPAGSPILQGAKNIELTEGDWFPGVQGPHHLGLQQSHEAYRAMRAALLAAGA